jgi:hypothetical protein
MSDIAKTVQDYKKAIAETERTLAQDEGSLKVQEESLIKEIGNASPEFVTKWLQDNGKEIDNLRKQIEQKIEHLTKEFPL